jgi:putative nucleotidyltransferase with HDIG domain
MNLMTDSIYGEVIKILGIFAHMREPYDDHGAHVAALVVKMTKALHIPADEAELIRIGAHLHDCGKLLMDPDLINQNRRLSGTERSDMQRHPGLGFEAVQEAGYPKTIQDIIHHHQEKWDGSGYPLGLQNELIPLAARIISICDVYAAMTHQRPYREAYTHEFTKVYMQSLRGKDFDPRLVDLFFDKVAVEQSLEEVAK